MVLLIPIVFAVAIEAGVPLLYLGISMTAALSSAQGFLPPQPAPTAVATSLGANIGLTLILGLIVSIITAVVAGPLFTKLAQKYAPDAFQFKTEIKAVGEVKEYDLDKTPSFILLVSYHVSLPIDLYDHCDGLQDDLHGWCDAKEPKCF